ncbi:MAG: ATPase, T2SS/T4P/T4SS family [Candidatus Omnitrophota bacterium]
MKDQTGKTKLLGERLVEKGLVTQEELGEALKEHKKTKEFLGAALMRLGFVKEDDIYAVLSEQLNIPYVKLESLNVKDSVIKQVPAKLVLNYKLMPIKFENDTLTIAISDPLDIKILDDLRLLLDCEVVGVLAGSKDIMDAIKKYYGVGADTIQEMMKIKPQEGQGEISRPKAEDIENMSGDASIIKFVNQILRQSIKEKATDIHIEPFEDEIKVRYRIDGILYDTPIPQEIKYFSSSIVSRIKIMANLDIAEKRIPQDGRIKIKMGNDELDLRISTLPTPFGESVNIRILTQQNALNLDSIGLSQGDMKILEKLIKKPHGIIFTTGPTGSGKTTTLYSCLSKINRKDKKIITIEDPIEYQIKGITQIQVNPKTGLTFAQGLRSMLRHDPDIMMVGEVRDFETAEITIRSALTGHLVFSTIHTNDAAGGVARLLDIGIEPYLLASSVDCFLAQRLVRMICSHCKEEKKVEKSVIAEFGAGDEAGEIIVYEGKGCEKCKGSGYRGRTAIYEFLVIDEDIRSLILKRVSADEIKKKALEKGMRTLRMDGWEKIKNGLTTISEVIRVTEED